MKKTAFSFLFCAFLVLAQADDKKAAVPEPTPVPAELTAEFYRADAALVRAQVASKDALDAINKFCESKKGTPSADPKDYRKFVCMVPVPTPAAK